MKKKFRVICGLLAAVLMLSACGADVPATTAPTTAPTTKPTTKPKDPNPLAVPQGDLDPNRPLPVLAPKFVTDTPAEGDLILAKDGKAMATIVYATGKKAENAAKDLADYLNQITGATFTMVSEDAKPQPSGSLILVGNTKRAASLGVGPYTGYPEAEKFTVKREGNCLVLIGNDDKTYTGTQHAVTYFLEEAGFGWFAEDPLWQVVPECPTLAVKDVDKTVSPRISGRKYGGKNTDKWYAGGDNYAEGHRLNGLYSAQWCMDNKPEWLALYQGSRDYTKPEWWQYCYTNAEFAAAVGEKVVAYFDAHPDTIAYSIAANDGWYDGWCECDTCKAAGNQSDQYMIFANRVAEVVAEKHPDKLVSFLAYHATFPAPQKEHKAHPNVQVMFCVETTPIDDLAANRQVHNGYMWINQVTYTQSWLDNVSEYIEKTDLQHVAIWGWYCISNELYGWQNSLWIQGNVASRNLELFEKLGVEHIFYDSGWYDVNLKHLRWPLIYTFAKCAYFGDMTGEEALYDACKRLYGNAADEMFLFYRHLADAAQIALGSDGVNWVPPALDSVYWNNYDHIVDAAEAVRAKLDTLTPAQKARAEHHLRAWDITNWMLMH